MSTIRTSDFGLILPMHEVCDDRVVALQMVKPTLAGNNPVGPAVALDGLGVGLDFDTVEILVQTVKQIGQELLGIVLVVAAELDLGYKNVIYKGDRILIIKKFN